MEYVSQFARERVLSSLRYALAEEFIPFHEIELPPYRSASDIVRFLTDQFDKIESGVVSISGFATAFPPEARLEDSLRVLNFNRENLVPATLRQVWWLPSSFAETFVTAVPDLDSWFTVRLYLTEEVPSPWPARPESDYHQERLHQVSNIPPRNDLFTGRDDVLHAIQNKLETDGVVVISGLGGIGKTQTAFEYANRHRDNYKTLLWTLADNEDSLTRGLFKIAWLLDLPEVQQADQRIAIEAVREWLQFNENWLLILDELTDTFASLLSTGKRGHVLATSRRRLFQSAPTIELSSMTREESRTLLFRRAARQPSDDEESRSADKIAAELEHLPLTLDLAGAYIWNLEIGFGTYLMRYREYSHESQLTERGALPALSALNLSLRALENPAQDLLKVCSFFNPDEIPFELVTQSLESFRRAEPDTRKDYAKVGNEIIRAFDRYSLMHGDLFSRLYSMHRLVQANIRHRMDKSEQLQWAEKAVKMISQLFSDPASDWAERERLLPTALTSAELIENWDLSSAPAIALLAALGSYLRERAQYRRAEPLLRRALRLVPKLAERDGSMEISISGSLASLYYDEGRYEEAKRLISRVLNLQETLVGSKNPVIATSLRTLAQISLSSGDYEEAESLLRRALEIQLTAPEQDPRALVRTIYQLAMAYLERGRQEDAERLFKVALEVGGHVLTPEDPAIIRTTEGLARSYLSEHKYEQAKPIYEQLLRLTSKQPQDPEYAELLTDLAYIYINEQSLSKAESLLRRALDIQLRGAAKKRSQAARILNYLAFIYFHQNRFEEAERSLRQGLNIQEQLLGPGHPDVVTTWENYATILHRMGREEEAREFEKRARITLHQTDKGSQNRTPK